MLLNCLILHLLPPLLLIMTRNTLPTLFINFQKLHFLTDYLLSPCRVLASSFTMMTSWELKIVLCYCSWSHGKQCVQPEWGAQQLVHCLLATMLNQSLIHKHNMWLLKLTIPTLLCSRDLALLRYITDPEVAIPNQLYCVDRSSMVDGSFTYTPIIWSHTCDAYRYYSYSIRIGW